MPLQAGAGLSQGGQPLEGEIASFCQGGVKDRGGMALAQDKTVAVGPVRVSRIVPHDTEIERSDYISG